MKLLLDTNVLIWSMTGDARLRPHVRETLSRITPHISHVSVWEVAIKLSTGRPIGGDGLLEWLDESRLPQLPIRRDHVWAVRTLPRLHRDPFDRLLIAQALIEGMTLVTSDRALGAYGAPVLFN